MLLEGLASKQTVLTKSVYEISGSCYVCGRCNAIP